MMHSRSITSSPRAFAIGAIERSLQLCFLRLVVLGGSFGVAVNLDDGLAFAEATTRHLRQSERA